MGLYSKYKYAAFDKDLVQPGEDKSTVGVTRSLSFSEVTSTQLSCEFDDALLDLYRGLSFVTPVTNYISTYKSSRSKPRISILLKVSGTRKATAEEKDKFSSDSGAVKARRERNDEDTLQKIHDRNPHLFNMYR